MFKDYDEFDIALALYHWLQHNWDGMSDPLYAAFCELTAPGMFKPGMSATFENVNEEALDIYNQLTFGNYEEAMSKVLNYTPQFDDK